MNGEVKNMSEGTPLLNMEKRTSKLAEAVYEPNETVSFVNWVIKAW